MNHRGAVDARPCFKNDNFDTFFGKTIGCHGTGDAGADDDHLCVYNVTAHSTPSGAFVQAP